MNRSSSNSVAVSSIRLPVAADLARVLVHGQVGHGQLGAGARARHPGPAQQPAQPGDDLLQAERLGHVVIAAGGDPADPVLHRVPRGQEQHADMRQDRPYPAQYLNAVEVRQHDVQQDRVRLELAGRHARPRCRPRPCGSPSPRNGARWRATRPGLARRRRRARGPGCRPVAGYRHRRAWPDSLATGSMAVIMSSACAAASRPGI